MNSEYVGAILKAKERKEQPVVNQIRRCIQSSQIGRLIFQVEGLRISAIMFVEDIESSLKELEGNMFDANEVHSIGAILKTDINGLRDAGQQVFGKKMVEQPLLAGLPGVPHHRHVR